MIRAFVGVLTVVDLYILMVWSWMHYIPDPVPLQRVLIAFGAVFVACLVLLFVAAVGEAARE